MPLNCFAQRTSGWEQGFAEQDLQVWGWNRIARMMKDWEGCPLPPSSSSLHSPSSLTYLKSIAQGGGQPLSLGSSCSPFGACLVLAPQVGICIGFYFWSHWYANCYGFNVSKMLEIDPYCSTGTWDLWEVIRTLWRNAIITEVDYLLRVGFLWREFGLPFLLVLFWTSLPPEQWAK
jgi:hypothetical protein